MQLSRVLHDRLTDVFVEASRKALPRSLTGVADGTVLGAVFRRSRMPITSGARSAVSTSTSSCTTSSTCIRTEKGDGSGWE